MGRFRMLSWLAAAAAIDWFFGRTFSRSAIFMPKSPAVLWGYEAVTTVARFAANLAALLVILATLWFAWRQARHGSKIVATLAGLLVGLALLALIRAPTPPARVLAHLAAVTIVAWLVGPAVRRSSGTAHQVGLILPAAALIVGELYLLAGTLPAFAGGWPAGAELVLFALGEALAVAAGFALLWWLRPGWADRWLVAVAAVPALGFAALYLATPSMTGVLAIWSMGLTLYLPWPLYALGLWACAAAALIGLVRGVPLGVAVLLLVAAGYAPQLSSQLLFGIMAIVLLTKQEGAIGAEARGQTPAPVGGWLHSLEVEPQ